MLGNYENDYEFLVSIPASNLINTFCDSVKNFWPNAIVTQLDSNRITISRDQKMEDNWEWQTSSINDFDGEGLIDVSISPCGYQEMDIKVRQHHTLSPQGFQIEGGYDSTIVSKDLHALCLCLPWPVEECAFSKKIYNLLRATIIEMVKP